MNYLTRDQMLAPVELPHETVPVPEWQPEGQVEVWTLNGDEKDEFDSYRHEAAKKGPPYHASAIWAAFCIKDASGARIFTVDDIEPLGKQSSIALDRVFQVALRLNHARVSDIEATEKNSASGGNGDSLTGSPLILESTT